MDIVNRIGIPPLNLIRGSKMGKESFSTATCFVLKAGVYGDAHARTNVEGEEKDDETQSTLSDDSMPSPNITDRVYCPMCKKSLKNWHCLKSHIEHLHSVGKKLEFSCFHCRKKFNRKGNLTRHLKTIHFPQRNK